MTSLKPAGRRAYYTKQAREMLRAARDAKMLTYAQLADRLRAHGTTVSPKVLMNRINRGNFSFAFAMQVLAALDVETVKIPNVLGSDRARPGVAGTWKAPKLKHPSS